ncbi:hypothetical protein DB31_8200 [Hyalangium minutum]|uniref:Uncharacterized protein n=1 Tax=Hyalangium minutum TaxID=394096 RepID=A0A085WJ54_9BACT|nr:hypothetical protein DB31_8200 [Hyalangium minutum]
MLILHGGCAILAGPGQASSCSALRWRVPAGSLYQRTHDQMPSSCPRSGSFKAAQGSSATLE